jgi:hypothetical protein
MSNNAIKGALLVAIGVLLGVLILGSGLGSPDPSSVTVEQAAGDDTTTTTAAGGDSTTTTAAGGDTSTTLPNTSTSDGPTSVTHPPNEVRVLVANGTDIPGAASQVQSQLVALGYNALSPQNGPPSDQSWVYYEPTYQGDARAIADSLGIAQEQVAPMPEPPPIDTLEANVLVLIGNDGLVQPPAE